jgi:membrane-associated phospholipid phosphatase
VVWAALSFPLAVYADPLSGRALLWALIYTGFVCVLPVLYIAFMVKRGHITDIHIKVRRQRIIPFLVSIACAGLAVVLLMVLNAPPLITFFALFTMLEIVVMLIITTRWQISMHALGISGAAVVIAVIYGALAGLLMSVLVPVVGAARVVLHRHTVAQVIAGSIVGATATALMFLIVPR